MKYITLGLSIVFGVLAVIYSPCLNASDTDEYEYDVNDPQLIAQQKALFQQYGYDTQADLQQSNTRASIDRRGLKNSRLLLPTIPIGVGAILFLGLRGFAQKNQISKEDASVADSTNNEMLRNKLHRVYNNIKKGFTSSVHTKESCIVQIMYVASSYYLLKAIKPRRIKDLDILIVTACSSFLIKPITRLFVRDDKE